MTPKQHDALRALAARLGWTESENGASLWLVKTDCPTVLLAAHGDMRESMAKNAFSRVITYGNEGLSASDLTEAVHDIIHDARLNPAEVTEVCRWTGVARPPRQGREQGFVTVDIVPHPDAATIGPVVVPVATYVPPFHSEWHLADAEFVAKLIERGGNFRKPARERVVMYADMMRTGQWAWEMEPWCVAADGAFVQGSHRAHATLEYLAGGGEPHMIEVRWDCPTWWGQVMDSGARRTGGQRVKALGHQNWNAISGAAVVAYDMATYGALNGHSGGSTPPTLMMEVLGTAAEPTKAAGLLHSGLNLADRIQHALTKAERVGWSNATAAPIIAVGLARDEDWTRTMVDQMIRSTSGMLDTSSTGAPALMSFYRTARHITGFDRSRYERRHRLILAWWLTWRSRGDISYSKLKSLLLSPQDDILARKIRDAWQQCRGEIQTEFISLLLGDDD